MKKLTILFCGIFFFFQTCFSQTLFVQGEKGSLYLTHKVVPKENWYSVGRLYNISPKEIAPFNNSSLSNPLGVGQELKIPLTEINFSQTGEKSADETLVPVYHTIQPAENIYKVSASYNAVPVSNLEAWNNIKKEKAKSGMRLIVGYLKVKTSLSALSTQGRNVLPIADTKESSIEKSATVETNSKENKNAISSAEKKQVPEQMGNTPTVADNKPVVKNTNVAYHSGVGGYFVGEYNNDGTKSKNGLAGTFKSTSGWQDGKYYALMNNVQVGTIIKVIAPATQKSVYAKVLGQLPDMKESEGLTIRISNAAANELGEAEGKFNVEVRY
jgi:LysM repeat protein